MPRCVGPFPLFFVVNDYNNDRDDVDDHDRDDDHDGDHDGDHDPPAYHLIVVFFHHVRHFAFRSPRRVRGYPR